MNIYSIKNEKLGFFNRPIYCESHAEALTYIQNVLMSDADRALRGLRGDLSLYYLGSINFETGAISSVEEPVMVSELQDIFDTIPEDKIPRDSAALLKLINELSERVQKVEDCDVISLLELEERVKKIEESDDCSCDDSIIVQILNLFKNRKKGSDTNDVG